MAVTRGKKLKIVKQLGMFFAEIGYIPNRKEYSQMKNRPKFLTVKEIDRICKSWTHMLLMLEKETKDLWELIHQEPSIEEKMEKAQAAAAEKEDDYDEQDV